MSQYPDAIDRDLVGTYPAWVKAGAGYFFDEVLEYRVWYHPEDGAPDKADGSDYHYAFATYKEALEFAAEYPGAEEKPDVLIRQWEWIDEPEPGRIIHMKVERIAEWDPDWLSRGVRKPGAIEALIAARTNA